MDRDSFHPTERFSDRVSDYIKYRPKYPEEILDIFSASLGLTPKSIIVDVGSGTGISAELFLKNGNTVYGVEPNTQMRKAAEHLLEQYPNFHSVEGSSEKTTLSDNIADFVIAAQAFHWFEPIATREEFRRILKEEGYVVLIWNKRIVSNSGFSQAYEALINEFGTDYQQVKSNIDIMQPEKFLGTRNYGFHKLYNYQDLNFEGLLGRLTSCSFIPQKDKAGYLLMQEKLQDIFQKYNHNDLIRIEYNTELYYSQL